MEQDKVHWVWLWHIQVNDCCGNDSSQYQNWFWAFSVRQWLVLIAENFSTGAAQSNNSDLALDRFVFSEGFGREILPRCACPVLGLLPSAHGVLVSHSDCTAGLEQEEPGNYSVRNRCNTTRLCSTWWLVLQQKWACFPLTKPALKQVIISFPLPVSCTVWRFPNCGKSFNDWEAQILTVVQIVPQQMIIPHSTKVLTAGQYDSAVRH